MILFNFEQRLYTIKRLQIKNLTIINIETKNKDAFSKELPKSTRGIIFLYFKNVFTSDELHSMKTSLIDSLNCSEIVSLNNFINLFYNEIYL